MKRSSNLRTLEYLPTYEVCNRTIRILRVKPLLEEGLPGKLTQPFSPTRVRTVREAN